MVAYRLLFSAALALFTDNALAQGNAQGAPDPPGVPFPGATYPGAESPNPITAAGSKSFQVSPPSYPSPWGIGSGDWAGAYAKARSFVSQLTLTEKVNLTTGVGWEGERCVGQNGAIPRLGFRSMCMQDSPLGVRDTDFNSAFPAGVTVASTWSRKYARDRGNAMGSEHRDKGVDVQLGPVAGPLGRAPEGGRNWEGFSPDPYLTGVLMGETVQGIQSAGVIACSKHYIGNEQEHFRNAPEAPFNITQSVSANIDDVTMHELYLWPFADAVRAGTGSIMCSYNQVNNSYACQNSYMLNHLLKGELGFQGFVMSDWTAQHTGVASTLAGLDMTMPGDVAFDSGTAFWGPNTTIAVLNGTVPQWRLDDQAVRIMAAWYYVDREAHQVPINFDSWSLATYGYQHPIAQTGYGLINEHVDVRGNHGELIRELSAAGTVLLKNVNGALPITKADRYIGVFGEDAGPNPLGADGCSDRGCDMGTMAMGWGSGTANFPYLVTPDTALQNAAIENGQAYQAILDNYNGAAITALAQQANKAIVFVNSDSGEGYISVDNNVGDRNNLTFWQNGDAVLQNVSANCNNTILVMHSPGPMLIADYMDHPNITAIVWAAVPGEQSGNSITDVLYGKVNPGGKLPFTFGATRKDFGTDLLYEPNNVIPQLDFTEGVFIDYRSFDKRNITPSYEFGFGLSYTTFSFSNLQVQAHTVEAYTPNTAGLPAAPTYGTISNNSADYLFPSNIDPVYAYIYPYLNTSNLQAASQDPDYGVPGTFPPNSMNGSAQAGVPAGGAPGGNPKLYDVLYTVTATVTNTGKIAGDEVPQLYVSQGGPYDPVRVLRGFERMTIQPGQSVTFSADLTRRDLSNWDVVSQNWVITSYPKTVYVGNSSRNLPLSAVLGNSSTGTGGGSGNGPSSYSYNEPTSTMTPIPVSEYSDGQAQVVTKTMSNAPPVSEYMDGQPQVTANAGK